jgi:predicted DNA-binding protein
MTFEDLPLHWQTGEPDAHAHDSRYYDQRYMLRLDAQTRQQLDDWSEHVGKPIAEIIRQLVAQATSEDFPQTWQAADTPSRAHLPQDGSTRRRMP